MKLMQGWFARTLVAYAICVVVLALVFGFVTHRTRAELVFWHGNRVTVLNAGGAEPLNFIHNERVHRSSSKFGEHSVTASFGKFEKPRRSFPNSADITGWRFKRYAAGTLVVQIPVWIALALLLLPLTPIAAWLFRLRQRMLTLSKSKPADL